MVTCTPSRFLKAIIVSDVGFKISLAKSLYSTKSTASCSPANVEIDAPFTGVVFDFIEVSMVDWGSS